MTNPRLVNGLEILEDGRHTVRVTWDRGTEKGAFLPKAYFEAVRTEDESGIVQSVGVTNDHEITITFLGLNSYLQKEKVLNLSLIFPDRAGFIDCRHSGMDDTYFLNMSLTFTDEGKLDKVTFKQSVFLGPI